MAAAQDGTFTCAGHMEGTGSQKYTDAIWLRMYTVLCLRYRQG